MGEGGVSVFAMENYVGLFREIEKVEGDFRFEGTTCLVCEIGNGLEL